MEILLPPISLEERGCVKTGFEKLSLEISCVHWPLLCAPQILVLYVQAPCALEIKLAALSVEFMCVV